MLWKGIVSGMELSLRADAENGLSDETLERELSAVLNGHPAKKVLIIPPDHTRFYSKAGFLTSICYRHYTSLDAQVDIMPALGTHAPLTREEAEEMFEGVPFKRFIVHNWRKDVVKLGEIPGAFIAQRTGGLWTQPVEVEINRLVMDDSYDLIISPGQVVPHEVAGMANHAKNLFVGVGGSDMINKSHMVGAVYGMERMMGRDHTPVRDMFDYAYETFLGNRPVLFLLTVTTAPGGNTLTHGLFCGSERDVLDEAVKLAQEKNIDFLDHGIKKCVVYLEPGEFKSTWLGNKAIYRTRMAIADGGELIVLAPGVARFGEDEEVDALIRKYGYRGRERILEMFNMPQGGDLRANMGAAAHLIHGSSDGRFSITYAVKAIPQEDIASVGFTPADYDEAAVRYDPRRLAYGMNTLPDGEEVFFIPNPALGLWIDRERFS